MVIFHSSVSLPEGKLMIIAHCQTESHCHQQAALPAQPWKWHCPQPSQLPNSKVHGGPVLGKETDGQQK